jgi:hypothetical protein
MRNINVVSVWERRGMYLEPPMNNILNVVTTVELGRIAVVALNPFNNSVTVRRLVGLSEPLELQEHMRVLTTPPEMTLIVVHMPHANHWGANMNAFVTMDGLLLLNLGQYNVEGTMEVRTVTHIHKMEIGGRLLLIIPLVLGVEDGYVKIHG